MAQHPDLPSSGFPISTIFTLGTENGITLICIHTEANNLYLFTAFIRRNDFTVWLHWTSWKPGEEETVIHHHGVDVPVDSKEPIISAAICHQHYQYNGSQFQFHPTTEPSTEPQLPGHPPIYTSASEGTTLGEHSPFNPAASTTRLYVRLNEPLLRGEKLHDMNQMTCGKG